MTKKILSSLVLAAIIPSAFADGYLMNSAQMQEAEMIRQKAISLRKANIEDQWSSASKVQQTPEQIKEAEMLANRSASLSNTKMATTPTILGNAEQSTPTVKNSNKPKSVPTTTSKQLPSKKKTTPLVTGNNIPNIPQPTVLGSIPTTQSGGSILSRVFEGDVAAMLNVGSVIAQETGDEKTAKYLLGAGGLVGMGDVAQDILSGKADMASAIKGVAAAGAIYAATSGDEDKVKDFGRGAAILGSTGAYAHSDGVFGSLPHPAGTATNTSPKNIDISDNISQNELNDVKKRLKMNNVDVSTIIIR